jgi:hypothetical protein
MYIEHVLACVTKPAKASTLHGPDQPCSSSLQAPVDSAFLLLQGAATV